MKLDEFKLTMERKKAYNWVALLFFFFFVRLELKEMKNNGKGKEQGKKPNGKSLKK